MSRSFSLVGDRRQLDSAVGPILSALRTFDNVDSMLIWLRMRLGSG